MGSWAGLAHANENDPEEEHANSHRGEIWAKLFKVHTHQPSELQELNDRCEDTIRRDDDQPCQPPASINLKWAELQTQNDEDTLGNDG